MEKLVFIQLNFGAEPKDCFIEIAAEKVVEEERLERRAGKEEI